MKKISSTPGRGELAYQAILDAICDGSLEPGAQLVQEELADKLGVSRQPIQQALARLKSEHLVEERPGRGLCVPPLDLDLMLTHYQIRGALDSLAAGLAASRIKTGELLFAECKPRVDAIMEAGGKAIEQSSFKKLIRHDVDFPGYIYEISGNPLLANAVEKHWNYLRRVIGDVLRHAEPPLIVWEQHEGILEAILGGDEKRARQLAQEHVDVASSALLNVGGFATANDPGSGLQQ